MKYEVTQTFDCSVEKLEQAFLAEDIATAFASGVRGYKELEQISRSDEDGRITRKLRVVANVEVPSFAAGKITPDMMMWTEEQVYDKAKRELSFRIVPNKASAADRFDSRGTQRFIADGANRSRRVINGEIKIKLTFIGGIAEKFVGAEFQKNLADEAEVLKKRVAG